MNINIDEIGGYPRPLIKPLPLHIGVYYGNDFRTYQVLREAWMPDGTVLIYDIQVGKANVALFDYILPNLFEKVTPVFDFSGGFEQNDHIDLIIEPAVEEYLFTTVSSSLVWFASIEYKMHFYLPDKEQITWAIEGYVERPAPAFKFLSTCIEELTQGAMRQVAARFMADFCKQEEINQSFYHQCNQ